MPAWRAASISSVPFSAWTCFPSMVSVTCSLMLHRHRLARGQIFFEILRELLDNGNGRQGRGVAQRAERPPQHVFGKFAQQRNILAPALAVTVALQNLAQPGGAFAARDAPAAAL